MIRNGARELVVEVKRRLTPPLGAVPPLGVRESTALRVPHAMLVWLPLRRGVHPPTSLECRRPLAAPQREQLLETVRARSPRMSEEETAALQRIAHSFLLPTWQVHDGPRVVSPVESQASPRRSLSHSAHQQPGHDFHPDTPQAPQPLPTFVHAPLPGFQHVPRPMEVPSSLPPLIPPPGLAPRNFHLRATDIPALPFVPSHGLVPFPDPMHGHDLGGAQPQQHPFGAMPPLQGLPVQQPAHPLHRQQLQLQPRPLDLSQLPDPQTFPYGHEVGPLFPQPRRSRSGNTRRRSDQSSVASTEDWTSQP